MNENVQDPPSKTLWEKLYAAKAYTKDYESFKKRYNGPSSIDELYGKLYTAKAFTKSKDDFYTKYFPISNDVSQKPFDQTELSPVKELTEKTVDISGVKVPVKTPLPYDPEQYKQGLQERVKTKSFTPEDVDVVSKGIKVSKQSATALLSGKPKTAAALQFIETTKNEQGEISNAVLKANKELGYTDDANVVAASPESLSEYIKKLELGYKQKTESEVKEFDKVYFNDAFSTDEYKGDPSPSYSRDIQVVNDNNSAALNTLKSIASRTIVRQVNAEQGTNEEKAKRIINLTDKRSADINKKVIDDRLKPLNYLRNFIYNGPESTQKDLEPLSYQKAAAELAISNDNARKIAELNSAKGAIIEDAEEKKKSGTLTPELADDYQKKLSEIDGKISEIDYVAPTELNKKYPILIKADIVNIVNEFNKLRSGNSADGQTGYTKSDLLEHIKANGYDIKDQRVLDAIKSGDFKSYSLFGNPVKSAIDVFAESYKSIENLTGLRDDLAVRSEQVTEQVFPTQAAKNELTPFVQKTQTIGNTTGQIIGQGLMQAGTAGIGRAAGMTKAVAASTGMWSSGALSTYDQSYKDAMEFVDSKEGRIAYAGLNALAAAATERIFPEGKIFNMPGVSNVITDLSQKMAKGEITEAVAKEMLDKAKGGLKDYVIKYGKNIGQETAEEVANSFFESGTRFLFGDPNMNAEKAMQNAKETAIQTALGTSLIAGVGAHKDIRLEKNLANQMMVYNAGLYHDEAKDAVQTGLEAGQFSETEAAEKIKQIEVAKNAAESIPKVEEAIGAELPREKKAVYVANLTAETILKEKLEESKNSHVPDELVEKQLSEKISNLQAQREQVISDPSLVITDDGDIINKNSLLKKLKELNAPQKLIDNVERDSKILGFDGENLITWATIGGLYYNNSKDIRINPLLGNNRAIIHESVHLVASDNIDKFLNDDYANMPLSTIEALSYVQDKFNNVKRNYNGLVTPYGLNNLHEFISEFVANRAFRNTVARNLSDNRHTIEKILDAVKDFFSTTTGISINSNINLHELDKINSLIEQTYQKKQISKDVDIPGNNNISTAHKNAPTSEGVKVEGNTTISNESERQEGRISETDADIIQSDVGAKVFYTDSTGNKVVHKDGVGKIVVNKDGKEVSAPTRRKVMQEHLAEMDFTKGEKAPEPLEPISSEKEYWNHIADTSNNPVELVKAYENSFEAEPLNSVEKAIAEHGIGKVKRDGFIRFNDPNNINNSLARTYFSESGQSIDVVAKSISDNSGIEVSPAEVADFMNRFPNGGDVLRPKLNEAGQKAAAKFQKITGFSLENPANGKKTGIAEIVKMQAEQELTDVELQAAQKLTDVEQIIADEGLNLETLENNKFLFDGFPYTQEDYENVKEYLHGESSKEPERAGQENAGNAESEIADTQSETSQTDSAVQPGSINEQGKQQYFENVIGAKPNPHTGRIAVDPIFGKDPKDISDILKDFLKASKQRLLYSKTGRGTAGTYSSSSTIIKLKYSGDLDTTAHEAGHAIDDRYKIIPEIEKNTAALKELPYFMNSPAASKPPKGHPNPARYKKAEGFAEWLRAYIVNPNQAVKEAPIIHDIYQRLVDPAMKKAVEALSNDIRIWSGSSARQMTMANVQVKPDEKGLLSSFKKDKDGLLEMTWMDKFSVNWLNSMRMFEKAVDIAKGMKGIDTLIPADDPKILSKLLLGIDGKFGEVLKSGMINSKNEVLLSDGKKKNLEWLLEPFDNTDEGSMLRDMQDTIAYMISERVVDLAERFGRDNIISGSGAGIIKDLDLAQKTLDEINALPDITKDRIFEAAKRYREFADDILKYMRDKGRISEQQYNDITEANQHYVALNRIMEAAPGEDVVTNFKAGGKANIGTVANTLRSIKGSARKIQNPYISLVDNLYKSLRESDRNEVMLSFRELIMNDREMYDGEPNPLGEIGVIGKSGDKNAIKIFVNGNPEYWIFHPEIYKGIKGVVEGDVGQLPGFMKMPGTILRQMTTKFPVFAVRNIIRDTQDRIIKSGDSNLADLVGNREHWKEVARAGGLNAGHYVKDAAHYYGLLGEAMHDLSKNKKFILVDPIALKEAWHKYEYILEKSETLNRVAEYRGALRKGEALGYDEYNAQLYAASRSRSLIDFAVAGHYMRMINQAIPFTNAAVQGLRSTIIRGKEDSTGFMLRNLFYSVLPAVAVWVFNHRAGDSDEEYENLPAYQRDLFHNLKVGDNLWLSIPKPYELSLPGAAIDRALSYSLKGNKKAFDGYTGTVLKSLWPFDTGTIAGPYGTVIENLTNYDFFRDKRIIPEYENNLDLALRHTEVASNIGKIMQEVFQIDARKIDHFIKGQFGYVGNFALKLSDGGNKFGMSDLGLFKESPAFNSPVVQELIDYAERFGLSQSTEYKDFKELNSKRFDLKSDAEKQKSAEEIISKAKEILADWKNKKVAEKKIQKFKEKNKN